LPHFWHLGVAICLWLLLCPPSAASGATLTARALADKLGLEYAPIRSAQDQITGARLSGGGHTVVLVCGLRLVAADGESIWLEREVRLENGEVHVPVEALGKLQRLFGQRPTETEMRGVVVLDPGHGGRDPGAIGPYYGTEEKEINLHVALRTAALLRERGVQVILTRDSDRYVELDERAAIANRAGADLFVSIHANASEDRGNNGFLVLYPADDWEDAKRGNVREKAERTLGLVPSLELSLGAPGPMPEAARKALFAAVLTEYYLRSREAAEYISAGLRQWADTPQQGPLADFRGLRVLRGTICPAVLVEVEYLSSRTGERRLRTSAFRERLARGIAAGIIEYLTQHPREADR